MSPPISSRLSGRYLGGSWEPVLQHLRFGVGRPPEDIRIQLIDLSMLFEIGDREFDPPVWFRRR